MISLNNKAEEYSEWGPVDLMSDHHVLDEDQFDEFDEEECDSHDDLTLDSNLPKLHRTIHFHHLQLLLDNKLIHRPDLHALWHLNILHKDE